MVITGIGGAFSVVAANSWMNQPQGFTLDAAGKVVDTEPLEGPLQPGDRLRGPAHDPRRLHGRRLPRRLDLRGRDAEGAARPPAPARAADPADDRPASRPRSSSSSATPRRARSPTTSRPSSPAWSASRRPAPTRPSTSAASAPTTGSRAAIGDPRPRLLPGRLQRRHQGHRARTTSPPTNGRRPTRCCTSPSTRWSGSAPRCSLLGALARLRLVAAARHPADALVPARGRGLRRRRDPGALVRLDRHRGRPPALDRPGLHAHLRSGHRGEGDLVQLRRRAAALRGARDRSRSSSCARCRAAGARARPRTTARSPYGPPPRPSRREAAA